MTCSIPAPISSPMGSIIHANRIIIASMARAPKLPSLGNTDARPEPKTVAIISRSTTGITEIL